MKTVEVSSGHSWFYKKGCVVELYVDDDNKIIDHKIQHLDKSIENICHTLFMLTGTDLKDITLSDNCITIKDFYTYVYNIKFPENVIFIHEGTCGCNMGHCSMLTSMEIIKYNTYGELYKEWCWPKFDEPFEWYSYPDGGYFDLKHVYPNTYNKKIHKDHKTKDTTVSDIVMTADKYYIAFSWSR